MINYVAYLDTLRFIARQDNQLCEGPPLLTKYLKEPLLLGIKRVLPAAIREHCLEASTRERTERIRGNKGERLFSGKAAWSH